MPAVNVKPIPTQDLKQLPFSLQEWMRAVSRLLYSSSGAIPVPSGGTGLLSVSQGDMLYGSATDVYSLLNKVATDSYLGNSGASNNPAWQAKAALTKTDDTNVTLTLGGTPATALLKAASLTLGWTGTLANSRGGTGTGTYAQGDLLYASAVNTLSKLTIGTSGKLLQSNGTISIWSAFSLPTSVGAVGTILRSDGTNWIASTPTFPNSGGTAGQWLRTDGTNYGLSTPTLANTAASGSFLRGDGTNWLQSTLTLPNAGTSGGVLYFNAANVGATSGALGSTQVVLGGGAGGAPNTSSNLTYNGTTLANAITSGAFFTGTGNTNGNNVTQFQNTNNGTAAATFLNILNDASAGFQAVVYSSGYTASGNAQPSGVLFRSTLAMTSGMRVVVGAAAPLIFGTSDTERWRVSGTVATVGNLSNTGTEGTAGIHFKAGTTAVSTAPWKATSGSLQTTAEVGAFEFLTDKVYFTITTSAARKEIALNDIALTSGRLVLTTTNGRLADSSAATISAGVITATGFTGALNGSLGATTPSTIAGTSGVFSGNVSAPSIFATLAGSGTAFSGPTVGVSNVAGTRVWAWQLNSTDVMDLWYFNGASTKLATFDTTGILSATGFTGAHNGTLGATTPNTVAATTGNFSSTLAAGATTVSGTLNVRDGSTFGGKITFGSSGTAGVISATGASELTINAEGYSKVRVQNNLDVTGAIECDNTVAVGAAVVSTHKVTMVINGTTYYLLASNV